MDQIRRDLADLRVAVSRLDTLSTVVSERVSAGFTRMDGIDRRHDTLETITSDRFSVAANRFTAIDHRMADFGYHLKDQIRATGDLKERLKDIEGKSSAIRRIEIMLPVILLLIAVVFKLPIGDIAALIQK